MISVGTGHVSFFSVTWISPGRDENAEPTDLREQHALGLHLADEQGECPWVGVFREMLAAGVPRRPELPSGGDWRWDKLFIS